MAPRHVVSFAREASYDIPEPFADHSVGFRRWVIADAAAGSHHMEFAVCELDAGGAIDWHTQSYEESFFVLSGEAVCETSEAAVAVRDGDYGIVPVGQPHTWRNTGGEAARWVEMLAPQPNASFGGAAVFLPAPHSGREPVPVDVRDPRTRLFGHIDPANVDKSKQSQELLAQSASMRTALLVYSGINIKMMVDTDLGAQLQTMFMVGYDAEGVAGPHDHPFEEAYLILEGEVGFTLDGEHYHLGPGDGAWAGAGCVHAAFDPTLPIRWIETQAPAPPNRHAYRWVRDWSYLEDTLS